MLFVCVFVCLYYFYACTVLSLYDVYACMPSVFV